MKDLNSIFLVLVTLIIGFHCDKFQKKVELPIICFYYFIQYTAGYSLHRDLLSSIFENFKMNVSSDQENITKR